jgi:sporulation protein YlmC with PRC-barrel domain
MKKAFWATFLVMDLVMVSPVIAADDEAVAPDRSRPMGSMGSAAGQMAPPVADPLRQPRFDQPLIRSADFTGNTVRGAEGNVLGKVSQVLFEAASGQVRYLVVSTAGVEGTAEGEYFVPWRAVKTDPEGSRIALDVSADQFKEAPQGLAIGSEEQAEELHRFYGVAPYWQESGTLETDGEKEGEHLRDDPPEPMQE